MSKSKKNKVMQFEAIRNAQKAVVKHVYIPPTAREKIEAQKANKTPKEKNE